MPDLLVVEEISILAEQADSSVLRDEVQVVEVLAVAEQGPPGIRGPIGPAGGATFVKVGAQPISGHSVVACDAAGLLVPADCTNPDHLHAVLGLVADAYAPGTDATVQTAYPLEHAGWSWEPGPVHVGADGRLVQALPAGALFSQVIGKALSATRVLVGISPPITLA